MSYVECLNNRYRMDIPLTYCIWLSELGVEMLSRVLPDREPMLTFLVTMMDHLCRMLCEKLESIFMVILHVTFLLGYVLSLLLERYYMLV